MQIEAGKYYRLRNGKKAFVACVLPEDPINPDGNKQPLIGFIQGSGQANWTAKGHYYDDDEEVHSHDIVADWSAFQSTHRPFKGRDEFWPFRNEWFRNKEGSETYDYKIMWIGEDGVGLPAPGFSDGNFVSWAKLFSDYTFANGDWCGMRNT